MSVYSKSVSYLIVSTSLFIAQPVYSSDQHDIKTYKDCLKIADNKLRLACYDSFAKGQKFSLVEKNKAVEERKKQEKELKEATFGLKGTKKEDVQKQVLEKQNNTQPEQTTSKKKNSKKDKKDSESLTIVVKDIMAGPSGSHYIFLENGQVWKLTGTGRRKPFKAPYKATIVPGALGSYFIKLKSGKKIRAKRLR